MKTLSILIFLCHGIMLSSAQVVSNVKWQLENDEKINITYDLARQDSYIYFDVSVKVTINNETVIPKALSGDVGSFVKIGTNKKITWNIFEDLTELNGELTVEVVAYNPVPTDPKAKATEGPAPSVENMPPLPAERKIPLWVGLGSAGAAGAGLLLSGLKSSDEGKDLYAIYKDNKYEAADIYTELGTTRDDVYSEANKKYKNGSLITIAGAAVLTATAAMLVKRIVETKQLNKRSVAMTPFFRVPAHDANTKSKPVAGLTLRLRF